MDRSELEQVEVMFRMGDRSEELARVLFRVECPQGCEAETFAHEAAATGTMTSGPGWYGRAGWRDAISAEFERTRQRVTRIGYSIGGEVVMLCPQCAHTAYTKEEWTLSNGKLIRLT